MDSSQSHTYDSRHIYPHSEAAHSRALSVFSLSPQAPKHIYVHADARQFYCIHAHDPTINTHTNTYISTKYLISFTPKVITSQQNKQIYLFIRTASK